MGNTFYPLTHAQRRIWYTEKFYPGTSVSNLSGFGKLKSASGIDSGLLTEAIRQFVRTNETMRFRLMFEGEDEPKQYIAEDEPFQIECFDASESGGADGVLKWGQAEARRPLPLYGSPLFKFAVVRISEEESWFFAKVHHIISDGISMTILGNRITDIYLKLAKGETGLEPVQSSFTEHIQSELEYENSKRFQKDKAYWNAQYEVIPEPVSLKSSDTYQIQLDAARFSKEISPALYKKIQTYCKEHNISVLSLFLSILHIYMHRITGQKDVVLGTFMGNRTNAKEKQMLGMFVSTIPMKASIDVHQDFSAFVQERMKDQLKIIRHQKYPYNLLINDLRERQPHVSKLFSVSLEYQVMQWQRKETLSFLTEPIFSGSEVNDISIHVKERWDTGTLAIDFDYREELFTCEEMAVLYERLMTLLEDALLFPQKTIAELEIVPAFEKERLLKRASSQTIAYDKNMTLHGLFEQKAADHPEKTAVVYEGQKLSYRELNEQSNRLARALRRRGIGPDAPAAIVMERSERVITAMLGVLKAGGAYVPIDPGFPEERIRFMLEDSKVKVVITDSGLTFETAETVRFSEALSESLENGHPSSEAGAGHLAYIIYTSGTTGRPKGVMIEHRQVHHLVRGLQQAVGAYDQDDLKLALLAPFHFDASVQQIFTSLLLGQTLYIVPKKTVSDGRALSDYYRRHQIDVTDGTPAHLQLLSAADDLSGVKLRHMLVGGEALSRVATERLLQLFAETAESVPDVTNVYGPTETCVDASSFTMTNHADLQGDTAYVPIGRPIGNNRFYILDENGALLPDGVEGELYIAGDGVGRGYLNLPDMTADKFLEDPFVPGGFMYRTGDAVRWLPDGTVDFIGRKDDQVKIRGYRIELGEIESVLQGAPAVGKAVVLARPETGGSLEVCAYVVPKQSGEIHLQGLREHLSKHLPDYMIPSHFVELDEIPLTGSGKVDRKALLRHEVSVSGTAEYAAPRNEYEEKMVGIWQEVLGTEQVGIHDQFFELGGHSLKAMAMLAKIYKAFGVEVPLQVLFEKPTVAALSGFVSEAEKDGFTVIEPAPESDDYPLSLAQQRIYIVSQLEDAGVGYNMPAAAMLEGTLDVQRLEAAFQKLIDRHEALRTSFTVVDGEPRQNIHQRVQFKIEKVKADGKPIEQMAKSFVRRFDLAKAPLMRAGLVRLADRRHVLLFDMHHLVSDGVSISIILNELAALYKGEELPEPNLHYKDYAFWQRTQAQKGFQKEEAYWQSVFARELPVLQLITDEPRPSVQSFEGDRVSAVLPKDMKEKLAVLAEQNGATLYMVMLAAYNMLLAKYSGQEDVIVGTPAAGRRHSDLEGIIGMFVNTLAIRSKVESGRTFRDFLHDVKKTVIDAFEHQEYPFERLAEKVGASRDLSRHPVFDTMFILQNAWEDIPMLGDLHLSIYETNFNIAKFDLTLQAKEEQGELILDLDYSTKLFKKDTAERMLKAYLHLLEGMTADPLRRIGEYSLLTEEETNRQLVAFNPAASDYPREKTIVQLFEEQAAERGGHPALQFEDKVWSYGELNRKANQLARRLRERGVQPGTTAAILTARSAEMVIGILAVLKAGAAYVPIDPDHPEKRVQHFFEDSGAAVLLTQKAMKPLAEAAEFGGDILFLEDEHLYLGDASDLRLPISPEAMANLTYTSGTTGTPKGNMVSHRNILRTVKNTNYLDVMTSDIVLSISNYVFDAFMFDVFGSLLNGAKLVIAPKDTILDMSRLAHVLEKEKVTVLMITTALFNLLTDMRPDSLKGLRRVLFGGERASVDHVRRALNTVGKGRLLHMYGPSESTVFTTYYPVNEVPDDAQAIPIGKPVSNTEVLILDSFGNVQPAGVAGELCVGGDGLVRGYFNRPELTAEKFTEHPFKTGEKIYRTGDMARWLADGCLEFIGRIDHQVKIRGQRIELGEIEHHLLTHEMVQEAAVLAVDTGKRDQMICAYFTADQELSSEELRRYAAEGLPGYMIPSVFMQLQELPLTGNGKVDRRALPEPDVTQAAQKEYTAPRSRTEAQLADLWQEVLNVPKIGVHDNFFELGGHSLIGMTLIARIQQEMNVDLQLKDLFQAPTIETLAQAAEKTEKKSAVYIEAVPDRDTYPVSSAQKRLYVLQQIEGAEKSYHMPAVLQLEGKLDLKRLESAAQMLIKRHEAFRTTFEIKDGEPVQRIWEAAELTIDVIDADEQEAEKLIKEFIRPFDLTKAPLFRMSIIRFTGEKHLLLVDMHHIISDGASVSVLIDEMTKLYAGEALEPLRIQYKDFSVWQQHLLTERHKVQEEYWLKELAGELPVLTLPADYPRPSIQTFEGSRLSFALKPELVQQLRKLAKETDSTLYMVLAASYSALLSKLSGQSEVIVGSPAAGRPHTDLNRIIGMFVNTLAIRTRPEGDKPFSAFLEEVKETTLGAFEHQDYPFEELIEKLNIQRDMSRNPLFDAVFSMRNADLKDLSMEGITLKPYDFAHQTAKFDLTLTAAEEDGLLVFEMEYNTALFKHESIERWRGYWVNLLEAVAENPDARLSELSLLDEAEKRRIVQNWNETRLAVPQDKTVHELFEAQVLRTPDRGAAVYNGVKWTYKELNARANRLARLLIEKGARPEQRIGIMVKPSLEMAAGVLAILKAGAAYVPIDPSYPAERIGYVLKDSGAELLLTQTNLAAPEEFSGETLLLDSMLSEEITKDDEVNPQAGTQSDNLAYLIYTSGTTGQPKGVMVEHRSLVNLCYWHNDAFKVTEQDKSAKYAGFGFDASVWEMFPYWIAGAELHIIDEAIRMDITRLNQYFEENKITITFLPTQLCEQFMELDNQSLRVLLTGGDKLKRIAKRSYTLVNNYGPTENTVVATSTAIDPDKGMLSIGKPIANTRAYVLGQNNEVQPVGVAGELCIAGRGLARGYLNKPEETAKRFTEDPFVPGERMYRTGDAVKWLEDGRLEYIGRIDQQVKIRGFRIELSEIEVQLARLSEVQEAVVTDIEDACGNKALCGYVVANEQLDTESLARKLAQTLPDYMVPSFWVQLKELPVTANGKVDRRALPQPDVEAQTAEYKAPLTETEQLLADIWQEVLGIDRIGITDNFFALGGDSIKGIQMASRLQQHGWKLEMKDLFQHPTIGELSAYVQAADDQPIDQNPVEGEVTLTPIQRWFFERRFTNEHHWNQSVMLHALTGFDPETAGKALSKLIEHHDALRMVYQRNGDGIVQYNRGLEETAVRPEVIRFNESGAELEAAVLKASNRIQSSIDLTEGPLLKAAIFKTDQGDHLLIVIHHLVVDGISWRILLEDFAAGYAQAEKGEPIILQDKTHSFAEYAARLEEYAGSKAFAKEIGYWQEIEQAETAALPKDDEAEDKRMRHTKTAEFSLSKEETEQLMTKVHEAYNTEMNDILLTALGLALKEWTGQEDFIICLEGHGREDIIDGLNISRTVGWFTSQFPALIQMRHSGDIGYQIKQIKEELRHIPNKGIGYGIYRYLTEEGKKAQPIKHDISFNYLGQFTEMADSGLFTRSTLPSGDPLSPETEKPNALDIVGYIEDGILTMSIAYHSLEYKESTVAAVAASFKTYLLQLIDHCLERDGGELTPSDLGDDELTLEELDKLMEIF
ncbi:lichenysin non-ribosomal peptide synthetase LicA [Bacillus paralicheniformis]|uniref:lichenysin non-ribosomal peptide synthetase LicA n=2 Tax=Bacillus paralicheniformis TaxID=1648923 RepID=UPI000342415F|nr:lichenysin non-ribosomal peptide synthetase LicA [Bacillus paralicheniformis]AGN34828.1 lichenysin synthase A [Bacillus paralicheniformis ATCC 9945a]AYQ14969.1 lichenysin non-ribosomal peptide synthetase LicA [Bacillus paralicheniformis]MCV9368672.1 lichenysin non-ribosomal peptide synthetase LicA [Bacillus paralicheniformis]MDI0242269.1 lichenysin non-ribosomal peptide synthetase LicA [Bacillus paralicheniformis]MEC2139542.1 lichenysin non-ribosomal peptide synthetase LicA [Bacillus parali